MRRINCAVGFLASFLIISLFAPAMFHGEIVAPPQTPTETSAGIAAINSTPTPKLPAIENSVVKIFAMKRFPDVYRPWTKQPPQEMTGSGVVIEGNRILTNAHVVSYASQVQIQANQSGNKISASVETFAPGIDLAVLKLDDETFFESHAAVPRANVLPGIKDTVMAFGFPTGGTSLSITKGIVSRIEFTPYNFPVSGLRIQVDAAINPGNSGGPAIAEDKMIGLAFSVMGGAQNIGYIIPNEEIEIFLADIEDGQYQGKPGMFDEVQRMQNPNLRSFLKLDNKTEGVIVHAPFDTSAEYPLKQWDVITKIGDVTVDNEGMSKIGDGLRVMFGYYVQKLAKDGEVELTIIRGGKSQNVQVPVLTDRPMLLPLLNGEYPPYFVYGPMVFSNVSADLFNSINKDILGAIAFAGTPLISRRGDAPAFAGEQLVAIVSPLFPHKLSQGYWPPVGWAVRSVDNQAIKNLRHLVEVLRDAKGEFVTFEFFGRGTETFTFPRKETLAATDEILSDNGVRAQASAALLEVWNAKPVVK